MASNRQAPKLQDLALNSIVNHSLFKIDTVHPEIGEKVWLSFVQAVIDDNRGLVKSYLDKHPELLMMNPLSYDTQTPSIVESKKTWQKFYTEPAAVMAAKRHQLKMLELLVPYYDKLEQTEDVINAKAAALSAWKCYETQEIEQGEEEIIIPKDYADFAQSLIDVFKEEDFPNGIPGAQGVVPYVNGIVPYNVILSEKTESTLSMLLETLVPQEAIKLDENIDAELLLLAIYKAYVKNFPAFKDNNGNYNWDKLDALCIRVMGLTQSGLIPETGEIFCEGLDGVVTAIENGREKEISAEAKAHKMKSGHALYRASRDSRDGAGFHFLCGIFGARGDARRSWAAGSYGWKNYVEQKQKVFRTLRSNHTNSKTFAQQVRRGPAA
jgi:hypothetical protein